MGRTVAVARDRAGVGLAAAPAAIMHAVEDFPARPDDDELLREEFDVLELAPALDPRVRVAADALLRAGEPEVELWLHEPGLAALRVRLTPVEARELASLLERQAAAVEHAEPSLARCPECDGRGVVVAAGDELYCERCDGAGTIPAARTRGG